MLEIKEEECTHLRSLLNEKSNSSNPTCRTEVNSTIPPTKPIPAPRKRPLKNKTKPKITILGSSMVRNTGPHNDFFSSIGEHTTKHYGPVIVPTLPVQTNHIFNIPPHYYRIY